MYDTARKSTVSNKKDNHSIISVVIFAIDSVRLHYAIILRANLQRKNIADFFNGGIACSGCRVI